MKTTNRLKLSTICLMRYRGTAGADGTDVK